MCLEPHFVFANFYVILKKITIVTELIRKACRSKFNIFIVLYCEELTGGNLS